MTITPTHQRFIRLRTLAVSLSLAVIGSVAQAQTSPPTSSSLNATAGPLTVSTVSVSSFAARGFGGGRLRLRSGPRCGQASGHGSSQQSASDGFERGLHDGLQWFL